MSNPCFVGDPQSLLSPGSSDPAADAADAAEESGAAEVASEEQVQGPMTRTRTSSGKQGEVPKLEGPYLPGCEVPRAGAPRTTDSGSLRKVKKVGKC